MSATVDPLDADIRRIGGELAAGFPSSRGHPMRALDARAMDLAARDRELKAALFRFVDVVPACRSLDDLARHLASFLGEVPDASMPITTAMKMAHTKAGRTALGAAAAGGVQAHGPPVHRRRDARRPRSACSAGCGTTASRARSICSVRRPSPMPRLTPTPRAAWTRSSRSRANRPAGRRGRCWSATRSGPLAAGERLGQGLRAHPAAATGRPVARARGRRPAPAAAAAPGPRARRPRPHRHGVARLPRGGARARARPARRGRVPGRPVGRSRAPGVPA